MKYIYIECKEASYDENSEYGFTKQWRNDIKYYTAVKNAKKFNKDIEKLGITEIKKHPKIYNVFTYKMNNEYYLFYAVSNTIRKMSEKKQKLYSENENSIDNCLQDQYFYDCLLTATSNNFTEGLIAWYEKTKRFSPKQRECIKRTLKI